MKTLIIEAFRWVNVPYTALLGMMLVYWITVVLGLLDVEVFDFDLETEAEGIDSLLGILNFGAVPVSIWLSVFAFQMWVYSILVNLGLDTITAFSIPGILRFVLCAVIFIPVAAAVTKLVTTPLNKLFEVRTVKKHEFVGKECVVTSSQVNENFGTAEVRISGVPQILDIRAKPQEGLKKNDKALIYEYDEEKDVFYVTKV